MFLPNFPGATSFINSGHGHTVTAHFIIICYQDLEISTKEKIQYILTKYFCITFQDALDRENLSSSTLKNAISNGSLDQVQNNGCLPQCISVDIRRRPISALAANSFWSGVSEIKDVLTTGKFGKYWIYLG